MIKVSIIVPIYNAEQYISRTIESLINQSLEEIEIILVNDGSDDNSLDICLNYKKLDGRIVVINKHNRGVSSARNKGLEYARGKYIGFVDADDYVDVDMYRSMYDKIEQMESELCICNYIKEYKEKNILVSNKISNEKISDYEIKEYLIKPIIGEKDISSKNGMLGFRGPVMYLYKTSIIKNENIRFDEQLIIGEDFLFNLNYMSKINTITIDKGYYYHYCFNPKSSMNKYREDLWEINKRLIEKIETELKEKNLYLEVEKRIDSMKINCLTDAIANEYHINNNKSYNEKGNNIKAILNDPIIKTIIQKYNIKNLTIVKKVWFIAVKNRLLYVLFIYYKMINLKNKLLEVKNYISQ